MEALIRPAEWQDLPAILEIYAGARRFMAQHGNPRQWNTTWPPEELLKEDIRKKRLYTAQAEGETAAVFAYLQGADIDPTYRRIENGAWGMDSEYGVVHRLASSGRAPGMGAFCLAWAIEQCGYLRVDTHGDNTVMQRLLQKEGFTKRGIIYVEEDSDPRLAYDKILTK